MRRLWNLSILFKDGREEHVQEAAFDPNHSAGPAAESLYNDGHKTLHKLNALYISTSL